MIPTPPKSALSTYQRIALLLGAIALAILLFLLRSSDTRQSSLLDQLARQSIELDTALVNKRPTMLEFYADWCEICREMAPAVLAVERHYSSELDVVLINVDNTRWADLIDHYNVNGIPQIELFDSNGENRGRSLGLRSPDQLENLAQALIKDTPLPKLAGLGSNAIFSSAEKTAPSSQRD